MDSNRLLHFVIRKPGALALVLAALILAPAAAHASTAANTKITNTASVDFKDAGGVAQTTVTASVDVTVTLVPSSPLISSPTATSTSQGTNVVLNYTITGTANGQDTYNLVPSITAATNDTGGTVVASPTSIQLGGTTLAANAALGATTLFVPYDQTTNGNINGLVAGSIIQIGAATYTIASLTENTAGNTSTITLTSGLTAAASAGIIIGEQKTFTVTVTTGTVTTGTTGTETVSVTGTSTTGPNPAGTQTTPTVVTVNRPTLTVTKTVSVDGGVTFVAAANAPPLTVLVYKVVAFNGGAAPANTVTFTDALPPYLTYQVNSGKFASVASAAAATALQYTGGTAVADGAGGYTFSGNTVTYNPGGATGTVASGSALVLFFQAKIN